MSFGKRTRPEKMARSIMTSQPGEDDDEEFEFKLPFTITRTHILAFNAFVAVFLISVGAIIVNDMSSGGSTIRTDSIIGNSIRGGHPVVFTIPDDSNYLSRIDTNINDQCFGSRMKQRQREALDNRGTRSQIVVHVPHAMISDYLVCTMSEEKQRFCQSHYRERLISRIKSVIRNRKLIQASYRMMTSNKLARRQLKIARRATERDASSQIETNGPLNGPPIDQHLGEALRRLMEDGYISTWDFGWFTTPPKEFTRFLAEPTGESPCP